MDEEITLETIHARIEKDGKHVVASRIGIKVSPDAYIATVSGDCLEPVLHDGDAVLVDPSAPVRSGDFAVIFPRGSGESIVKRIIQPPPWDLMKHETVGFDWMLIYECLNPRRSFSMTTGNVMAVHRVLRRVKLEAAD